MCVCVYTVNSSVQSTMPCELGDACRCYASQSHHICPALRQNIAYYFYTDCHTTPFQITKLSTCWHCTHYGHINYSAPGGMLDSHGMILHTSQCDALLAWSSCGWLYIINGVSATISGSATVILTESRQHHWHMHSWLSQ